jgi:hypothetical protein
LGRGIFSGESQPIVVDVDQPIGGVDDPDEAALIDGFFHSPGNAVMVGTAKSMHRPAAPP